MAKLLLKQLLTGNGQPNTSYIEVGFLKDFFVSIEKNRYWLKARIGVKKAGETIMSKIITWSIATRQPLEYVPVR